MKCPKCGYNSFEYYDVCKKCSNDLIAYKQTYGITSLVLPLEAREQMAAAFCAAADVAEQHADSEETHDDMFSFDLPDEASTVSTLNQSDDPFAFDDHLPDTGLHQDQTQEDTFANLLESTSQVPPSPHSAPKSSGTASGPGEFDLENFSWDEPDATDSDGTQVAADDFDALFGDSKETVSK